MFDKISLRAKIDPDDIDTIVLKNYLEQCTKGDEIYYKSTAYANFDGVFIEISGNTLKCKCSICKLFYKAESGKLDNSKPMTFAKAVRTIKELLLRLCVRPEDAVITYCEIGITMKMMRPAIDYIQEVNEISDRILWNDANFPSYRQKTTEKSRHYKKVMKIYDKTFESNEKGRYADPNIIRIETTYKHQAVRLLNLIDNANLAKLSKIFYEDWSNLSFRREIAVRGAKMSQIDKAREILLIGVEAYRERYKRLYLDRRITKKQWETIRNFARAWPDAKSDYIEEVGPLEQEFKTKLLNQFQTAHITPFKRKA